MKSIWKMTVRLVAAAFLFFLSVPGIMAFAQTQDDTLPPKAQEATNLGGAAAGKQEWELAIKYFNEAWKAAPYSRSTLFNLALAYDKAGKYDLVADIWYRAYLAAALSAQDAQTQNRNRLVRERIVGLEAKAGGDIQKLVQLAKEIMGAGGGVKNKAWAYVAMAETIAEAQIVVGDKSAALATISLAREAVGWIQKDSLSKVYMSCTYMIIANLQAKAGDITGAWATADKIEHTLYKALAYADIACAQVEAGDKNTAVKTIAFAKEAAARSEKAGYYTIPAYVAIANAQIRAGDMAAALQTITLAKASAGKKDTSAYLQSKGYAKIAEAQVAAGDKRGALETVGLAKRIAAGVPDWGKAAAYASIAGAQAKAGDRSGALQTIELAKGSRGGIDGVAGIAEAQTLAGDRSGALQTKNVVKAYLGDFDGKAKANQYVTIAEVQAEMGNKREALQSIALALQSNALAKEPADFVNDSVLVSKLTYAQGISFSVAGGVEANVAQTELDTVLQQPSNDEVDSWSGLFASYPKWPISPDWQAFVASLMKEPHGPLDAILRTAQNLASAFQDTRLNEAKLQKLRTPANR
jgi:hypothetical protein